MGKVLTHFAFTFFIVVYTSIHACGFFRSLTDSRSYTHTHTHFDDGELYSHLQLNEIHIRRL